MLPLVIVKIKQKPGQYLALEGWQNHLMCFSLGVDQERMMSGG